MPLVSSQLNLDWQSLLHFESLEDEIWIARLGWYLFTRAWTSYSSHVWDYSLQILLIAIKYAHTPNFPLDQIWINSKKVESLNILRTSTFDLLKRMGISRGKKRNSQNHPPWTHARFVFCQGTKTDPRSVLVEESISHLALHAWQGQIARRLPIISEITFPPIFLSTRYRSMS